LWPINYQTGKNKTKLLTEYESITQKVLFGKAVLAALLSGRKYDIITQNGDGSRESNVRNLVSETKFVIKTTELNMENIHLQIMLSGVG
jgi:hypothetical protein